MTPLPSSAATLVVAVDDGSRSNAAAEHLLHHVELLLAAAVRAGASSYVASTHVVTTPEPHVAIALSLAVQAFGADGSDTVVRLLVAELPDAAVMVGPTAHAGPDALVQGAREAAEQHIGRSAGRLVRFPGHDRLEGSVTVADVLARTCVDQVSGLAGVQITTDTVLDLGDFVRPTWREAQCTVLVQQASWGLIPFEVRDQQACCSNH